MLFVPRRLTSKQPINSTFRFVECRAFRKRLRVKRKLSHDWEIGASWMDSNLPGPTVTPQLNLIAAIFGFAPCRMPAHFRVRLVSPKRATSGDAIRSSEPCNRDIRAPCKLPMRRMTRGKPLLLQPRDKSWFSPVLLVEAPHVLGGTKF